MTPEQLEHIREWRAFLASGKVKMIKGMFIDHDNPNQCCAFGAALRLQGKTAADLKDATDQQTWDLCKEWTGMDIDDVDRIVQENDSIYTDSWQPVIKLIDIIIEDETIIAEAGKPLPADHIFVELP